MQTCVNATRWGRGQRSKVEWQAKLTGSCAWASSSPWAIALLLTIRQAVLTLGLPRSGRAGRPCILAPCPALRFIGCQSRGPRPPAAIFLPAPIQSRFRQACGADKWPLNFPLRVSFSAFAWYLWDLQRSWPTPGANQHETSVTIVVCRLSPWLGQLPENEELA